MAQSNLPAVQGPRAVMRRKPAAPENETKAERFRRLANGRVNVALEAIAKLGNLASSDYEYTEAQIAALDTALRDAVKRTIGKLATRDQPARRKLQIV